MKLDISGYTQESKFLIGASITPTITSLLSETFAEHSKPIISLAPGVNFEYRYHKNFSLISACAYEIVGNHYYVQITDIDGNHIESYKETLAITYLSIPLLISFHTDGPVKYFFNIGAFVGVGLTQEAYRGKRYFGTLYRGGNPVSYEKYSVGLSGGIGFLIPYGSSWVSEIGLRTNIGLNDIAKEFIDPPTKTGFLGLQVGMKYIL